MNKKLNRVLALVLTIAALFAGQKAHAENIWTVEASTSGSVTTFTIKRTGDTSFKETVKYRLVNLSAYAGEHYYVTQVNGENKTTTEQQTAALSGDLTFNAGDNKKTVLVQEKAASTDAYKYQTGTKRSYKLEVTDKGGFLLDDETRSFTTGTSVSNDNIFGVKSISVGSGETTVSDAGYINNPYRTMTGSDYYDVAAPQTWLFAIGATLHMTLSMTVKEVNDGYQYIQVLFDNTSSCDDRSKCNDGNPGNINLSRYMAGFGHHPGSYDGDYSTYTFPVTSSGNNCGEVNNPWSNSISCKLYDQKFKEDSYRDSNGKLIIPTAFTTLVLRLNASGNNEDNWVCKDVTAKIQAVDGTAPTKKAVSVAPGRHARGNTVYVSVAFSEIVKVTGTPTLSTTADNHWGNLKYIEGSGTNVLTFSTIIPQEATGNLNITGLSGTVKDLAGNSLTGSSVTATGLCSVDGDLAYAIDDFQTDDSGNYLITCHDDLRGLAGFVNGGGETIGLTFLQMTDLVFPYTTNWNNASSTENNFTSIGIVYFFSGTYNGGGHTVSGIRIYKGDNSYQGLFGRTSGATIKNVTLADARITGKQNVGGIAGYITENLGQGGIVENCRVGSDVTIHAVAEYANYHGGVVGYCNGGTIRGCVSAATLTVADGLTGIGAYGGIVGLLIGYMTDCLALGASVPAVNVNGAIAGTVNTNWGTPTNCYYLNCTVAGTSESNLYAITLPANASVVRSGTDLPGTNNRTYDNGADIDGVPYTCASSELTLSYNIAALTGYTVAISAAETTSGNDVAVTDNGDYTYTISSMPAAAITVTATPTNVWGVSADIDGTSAEKAYTISDTRGLNLLATLVNGGNEFSGKFFKLGNTITYDHTTAWDDATSEENNFTAIGDYNHPFRGTFDGQGKTIRGIRIYKGDNNNQGLFGGTLGATIKNVVLADARITGKQDVGGIAGYITANNSQGCIVENCCVGSDVTIHAVAEYAYGHGGVVGDCNGGTIRGCVSAATLTVANDLNVNEIMNYGGIVGWLNGDMTDCLALGASVPAVNVNGAIAGAVNTSQGTHTNNYYHSCTVSANTDQSDAYTISAGTDITVAPAGSADATYEHNGIKRYGNALYYNGVLYAPNSANVSLTLGYTGSFPAGFTVGYVATAGTISGTDNPYTLTMPAEDVTINATPIDVWDVNKGCDGTTAEKAYTISDTRGLNLLATLVNGGNEFSGKFFKLVNTITYDHTTAWDDATSEENNYTAIGGYYNGGNKYFCGTFDGQGNTVSGIRIYKAGTTNADYYQGLFGETLGATIKNVNLADARITGKQNVGGIAGYITDNNGQGGIVENCRVGSDVTIHAVANSAQYHGGVVGQCNGGTIFGCVSDATLTVANGLTDIYYYGGIVGWLNGDMSDCLALGASVPAVNVNGAIAGTVDTNWGTHTNNYHHGCTVGGNAAASDANNVSAYTISAGTDITVAPAGSADATYDYDGIQRFGDALYYGGVLYAPEAANVSLTLGTTIPEETFNGYAATAGTLTGTSNPYTLTMPDEDVTIIEKPTISYIDENGKEQICRNFSAIGERTEELTSGWYAALGDVENNNRVRINGDVKIILKDGVNLILNGGIKVFSDNSLTIYGQANGTGKLITGGWDQYASIGGNQLYESNQNAGNITINGGVVEAGGVIGSHDGSCAVTINGGTVSAYGLGSIYYTNPYANPGTVIINGGNVTLNGDGQLYTSIGAATVTINGGTVSAEGSIVAGMSVNDGTPTYSGAINIGWTNSTDRIKAGSYGCATLKVKSSQVLYDGTTAYEGTLDADQLAAIAGKTLEPYNATPFFIDGTAILLDDDSAQPDGYKNVDRIAALAANGQSHDVMLLGRTLYRDGDWNTLCLPFTVDGDNNSANKLFYNAVIMKFDYSYWYDTNGKIFDTNTDGSHRSGEVENGSLYLNFIFGKNNYIEAGCPYIVMWPDTELDNVEDPVFQGVTVTRTTPSYYTTEEGRDPQTGLGNVTFRGTYSPIDYTEDNHSILFLGTNNTLYYPEAGAHIGAFRCYFELGNGLTAGEPNSAVRGFNLNFDEQGTQTTGIIGHTDITDSTDKADAAWYTINGVKLDAKPNSKGVYIHGGRKVVIK